MVRCDVLTCVLPLGAAGRGLESEVDVAHLFLTIIQFHSACHLISQHTKVTNGVKQGCVLAPTLFSMMFSAMLMDPFLGQ